MMFFLVGRCLFIILDGPGSWMWRWRSLAASGSPSCKTCGWKAHKISVLGGGFCFLIFPPRKGERGRGWGVEGGVVILGDQIFISEIQVSTIFCLANNFVSLPFVGIFYFLNCFLKRNYFIVSLFAKRCTSHCQCSFAILAFYIYALERTCFPLFI